MLRHSLGESTCLATGQDITVLQVCKSSLISCAFQICTCKLAKPAEPPRAMGKACRKSPISHHQTGRLQARGRWGQGEGALLLLLLLFEEPASEKRKHVSDGNNSQRGGSNTSAAAWLLEWLPKHYLIGILQPAHFPHSRSLLTGTSLVAWEGGKV